MRLINTSTLELESFSDGEIPPYAILSHTWGPDKDEVTFQEMRDAKQLQLHDRPGFRKIQKMCQLALEKHGLDYAWVDTCAIDKSSSAELSEAINSMFTWYRNAEHCLVYLGDLHWDSDTGFTTENLSNFMSCKWFTRGWTLQELIAPLSVEFYDCDWRYIGWKKDQKLGQTIEDHCGIDSLVLTHQKELLSIPVAVRMSWASTRETKRPEDRAYCLLGLFDVNMPLLYGEGGEKAFIRLQEEIIKDNADLSIFAWSADAINSEYVGMLAKSPTQFKGARYLVPHLDMISLYSPDLSITNRGIRFSTSITYDEQNGGLVMPLCHYDSRNFSSFAIYLRQIGPDQYVRAQQHAQPTFGWISIVDKLQTLQIAKRLTEKQSMIMQQGALQLELQPMSDFGQPLANPRGAYDPTARLLIPDPNGAFVGYLEFRAPWAGEFDSFVLICRRYALSRDSWLYDLVRGDDWLSLKDDYRENYSSSRSKKLVLRHIFDEVLVKVIRAEIKYYDDDDSRTTLTLKISDR